MICFETEMFSWLNLICGYWAALLIALDESNMLQMRVEYVICMLYISKIYAVISYAVCSNKFMLDFEAPHRTLHCILHSADPRKSNIIDVI